MGKNQIDRYTDIYRSSQSLFSKYPTETNQGSLKKVSTKNIYWDIPDGSVVKNPPANAGEQFNPWSGKIPHTMEQLSLCTTPEPTCSSSSTTEARAIWSPCSATIGHGNEKPSHHNQRAAPACHNQRKSTCGNEDPAQPKIINTITFKNIYKGIKEPQQPS